MDDFGPATFAVILLFLAGIGIFEGVDDMLDKPEKKVIESCVKNGYWQYEQRRFICHEEVVDKEAKK